MIVITAAVRDKLGPALNEGADDTPQMNDWIERPALKLQTVQILLAFPSR